MSEIVGWLNEVKNLQQQLQSARDSEAAAHASADNWRKRYEIEAEQRRYETESMQQTIAQLRSELERVKTLPQASQSDPALAQIVAQLQTVPDLQAKLSEVWTERNQLAEDLKAEQADHALTRKNLTTALGDTVDLLAKLKESQAL